MCNTQNSLLLNQHNGDDAPQGYIYVTIRWEDNMYYMKVMSVPRFYVLGPKPLNELRMVNLSANSRESNTDETF